MFVYLIRSDEDGLYKVGISKSPSKRLEQLQTGNSSKLTLIETFKSDHARKIEQGIHNFFRSMKIHGEWFEISMNEVVMFNEYCKRIDSTISHLKKSYNPFI